MTPITIEELPVNASQSGRNSFYHPCSLLNKRAAYAVCLHSICAYEENRLPSFCECCEHIASGQCEALALRKQEQEAGRALFFQERKLAVVESSAPSTSSELKPITGPSRPHDASYMRGWNMAGGKSSSRTVERSPRTVERPPRTAPAQKTTSEKMFGVKEAALSDAVDRVIRDELGVKQESFTPPVSRPSPAQTQRPVKSDEPRPLMQYVASLIRAGDNERWKVEMTKIIRKFKLDQVTQKRLIEAAKNLARSKHPLDNAFIPESR